MAGASAAQPVPAATVSAVAAGCDALLYPEDFAGVAAALDRAVGGEISAARADEALGDRKSTRLNSSHGYISYAVFCLKKKKKRKQCKKEDTTNQQYDKRVA